MYEFYFILNEAYNPYAFTLYNSNGNIWGGQLLDQKPYGKYNEPRMPRNPQTKLLSNKASVVGAMTMTHCCQLIFNCKQFSRLVVIQLVDRTRRTLIWHRNYQIPANAMQL